MRAGGGFAWSSAKAASLAGPRSLLADRDSLAYRHAQGSRRPDGRWGLGTARSARSLSRSLSFSPARCTREVRCRARGRDGGGGLLFAVRAVAAGHSSDGARDGLRDAGCELRAACWAKDGRHGRRWRDGPGYLVGCAVLTPLLTRCGAVRYVAASCSTTRRQGKRRRRWVGGGVGGVRWCGPAGGAAWLVVRCGGCVLCCCVRCCCCWQGPRAGMKGPGGAGQATLHFALVPLRGGRRGGGQAGRQAGRQAGGRVCFGVLSTHQSARSGRYRRDGARQSQIIEGIWQHNERKVPCRVLRAMATEQTPPTDPRALHAVPLAPPPTARYRCQQPLLGGSDRPRTTARRNRRVLGMAADEQMPALAGGVGNLAAGQRNRRNEPGSAPQA